MEGGPNIQYRESTTSSLDENRPGGFWNRFRQCFGSGQRFVALFFMCFLSFGSYFCYDNPAALQDHMEKDLNITVSQYTMLYSVYSWPNVIFCFIGGFLLDRVFGIRLGTNIYCGLTMVGQIILATGVLFNQYWAMLIGRFIFGIGGESLATAQNNYAVLWFKGKELNMVFGLQLSFARVGSTVNFLVMESLYNSVHRSFESGQQVLGIVLFIACSTCIFSMCCALILGYLDQKYERTTGRINNPTGEVVRLMDVKDFKAPFWLVTLICVTYYQTIFPFITLGKDFFMKRFHMTETEANDISSLIYIISGVAAPLLGFLVDKMGKNIFWILLGVCATIGSHAMLGFTMASPYIGVAIMGLAYSTLASSLWPLIALFIPEYQLGTAYGLCGVFQNLGLAVVSLITGKIEEKWGYGALELFFIGSLACALLATVALYILDKVGKGSLNMTPGQRLRHQQSILAADVYERQRLLSEAAPRSSYDALLEPSSDFHIRNSSPPLIA